MESTLSEDRNAFDQWKTPFARNQILQGNESTKLTNTEAYFLRYVTATLTQLGVSSSRPNVCVEQTSRCCHNDTDDRSTTITEKRTELRRPLATMLTCGRAVGAGGGITGHSDRQLRHVTGLGARRQATPIYEEFDDLRVGVG
jgi:hypothetical protein